MTMLAEQSAFMKSACVRVLTSDARETVVGHTLSGRKYALGGDAFRLFDSLGQPTTVAHLRELLPHLEPSRLSAALEHLQQQELIVRCDEEIDETFHVKALAPTLCNVEAFNPAVAVPPRVVFLGVPYGGGNYLSAATARFPRAVRKYSRRINADFRKTRFVSTDGDLFDVDASIDLTNLRSLVDDGGIADWGNLFIHPQEYPRHVYDNVQKAAGMLLDRGHIPFVLGGDHSITLPVLQAFAGRVPDLHVLHFDAHTDTYDSPLDRVFEQRATHGFGNFASHAMRLEHVAAFHQIGIRGINNFGVKAHPKQHIHWIAESKRAAREHRALDLPADVPWYVTIDIDVLDPAAAPGTASPVPGGLAVPEFLQLLHVLLAGRRVVGVDLVEINPERTGTTSPCRSASRPSSSSSTCSIPAVPEPEAPMFEPFSYLERLVALRKTVMDSSAADYPPEYRTKPHFVSATLSHLLPHLDRGRHTAMTREILFHQQWSALDEQSFFLGDTTTVVDPAGVIASGAPVIFCTFHVGSYRLLNALLTRAGANFALVIDDRTLREQGAKFEQLHRDLRAEFGTESRFQILNAEDSSMGLRAMRLLKKGTSLVFYIDGNTGVGGVNRRDDHMVRVSLLGNTMFARRGVAFLSHFARVPILPVVCERTGWLSRTVTVHPAIDPAATPDRETFCREATQHLFDLLGSYLVRVPEQWEGWFYLYRFLDTDASASLVDARAAETLAAEETLRLDDERYELLEHPKALVLFDRLTYRCVPLSEQLHGLLSSFREPRRAATNGAVGTLIGRGVLRRATESYAIS